MTWTRAGDQLPPAGQPVLLYVPSYAWPRPALAFLEKGDPSRDGLFYSEDRWQTVSLRSGGYAGNRIPVDAEHLWAVIDPPDGVTWTPHAAPQEAA